MEEFTMNPGGIRLGQLLKVANLVDSGGEAKTVLAGGEVLVNGVVETRRGAQLSGGDVISWNGREVRVVAPDDGDAAPDDGTS